MLKKAEMANLYARAHYLATLALGHHAKKHIAYLDTRPWWSRWQWWDKKVSIEWLNYTPEYHEGDRLPVPHNPGDYILIRGRTRIGGGDTFKVEVRVEVNPYKDDEGLHEATVNLTEVNTATGKHTSLFDLDKDTDLPRLTSQYGFPVTV